MPRSRSSSTPNPSDPKLLYVGTGSHVVAIDTVTGLDLWRTKVKSSSTPISLLVRDGLVYVGSGGRVHCLDGLTGQLLWTNDLKGLGLGSVLMAMEGATSDAAAATAVVIAQQRAAAAAAASG
jgi:outer membrane protein assembly factor BamB